MKKILVIKHLAQESLGTFKPILADKGFRIRYINFNRDPDASIEWEKYQGLIILGGWMGVYENDSYPHLKYECRLLENALKKNIPILGICLGAQILAHTLGANVGKGKERELGWQSIELSPEATSDPLFRHFRPKETVFQMHGDTFSLPQDAIHLASSPLCPGQAFRYGEKAYGLQFHLETDQEILSRLLQTSNNEKVVEYFGGLEKMKNIAAEKEKYLARSMELSDKLLEQFIGLFGLPERPAHTRSIHGRTKK